MSDIMRELEPSVRAAIIETGRTIQRLISGRSYNLYQYIRQALQSIIPVDSFYVGYYTADACMVFPYTYDGADPFLLARK